MRQGPGDRAEHTPGSPKRQGAGFPFHRLESTLVYSSVFSLSSVIKLPSVKIAIDIRRMTEFGVGTYIRNVVRTLGKLDRENKYLLIGSPAKVKEIGSLPPNFHTVPLMEPERSVQGYRQFRALLTRFKCDLV